MGKLDTIQILERKIASVEKTIHNALIEGQDASYWLGALDTYKAMLANIYKEDSGVGGN